MANAAEEAKEAPTGEEVPAVSATLSYALSLPLYIVPSLHRTHEAFDCSACLVFLLTVCLSQGDLRANSLLARCAGKPATPESAAKLRIKEQLEKLAEKLTEVSSAHCWK